MSETLKNQAGCVAGAAVRQKSSTEAMVVGQLVKISASVGNMSVVTLPAAITDQIEGVIDDVISDTRVSVVPLSADREIRVKAYGTGSAGNELILTASAYGSLAARGAGSGDYFVKAVALEDFVSGQYVRCRPAQFMRTV